MLQRLIAPTVGLLLLALFQIAGLTAILTNSGLDLLFRMRGPRPPDQRLVIIGVDESSLQRLGVWPFARAWHAELLGRLATAKAVGFDFLFPESAADDNLFSQAMAKGPPVVLTLAQGADGRRLQPSSSLSGHHGTGHIETMLSGDGIVRRFQPRKPGGPLPFSEALLQAAGIDRPFPLAPATPIINYYGPEDTFLTLSYADVLAGRYPPEFFAGRIVLVGAKATGLHDAHVTSFTRQRPTPGVEIQATILANALERSFIQELPAASWLTMALIFALAALVWPAIDERAKLLLNLTLIALVLGIAHLLFHFSLFFSFLPVLLFLLFAYMAHLVQQLTIAAGRVLAQARQLSQKVDEGLRQVTATIPQQVLQLGSTSNQAMALGIQRHLDRLQMVLNALNLQHHFLENLLKKELPPLILWERHGGTAIFANAGFLAFWGRFYPDGGGELPPYPTFMGMVRKSALKDGKAGESESLGMGEEEGYLEVAMQSESGAKRYLQVSRHPLVEPETGFAGMLAILQDVTEIRELERVKDEVVAIVSHELKRPLTTLLGYGEILADSLAGDQRHYAVEICDQVRRLNRMIEDFLDVARLESGRRTLRRFPFPLGRMLEDAVGLIAAIGQAKNIDIVLHQPGKATPMLGDEPLLLQAVVNLLDNSVKFSPPHTRVTVSLVEEADQFVLLIADQGPGVPGPERQAIFAKFQRGSRTREQEGFGLGLHLVHQIITGHGGQVEVVDSAEGATFRVVLPKGTAGQSG